MEMTRRVMSNVEQPEGWRAPMGQFVRMRAVSVGGNRDVTAPNADTLYTIAWIDVGKEPWVVSLPDMKDRYFLLPMLDGWTDVFQDPGKRTTGTGAQKYAITGPGWTGTLPAGVKEYKSPTGHRLAARPHLLHRHAGRLRGRPRAAGRDFARAAERLRQALHAAARPVDPTIDTKTAVREQVNALSADYFNLLAKLMKDNPPAAADAPMVKKLAKLGIVPGQPFDSSKLGPLAKEAFAAVPKIANEKIMLWLKEGILAGDLKLEHGWVFTTKTGLYGANYIQRALVTAIGLGANRPQDAVYPTSEGPSVLSSTPARTNM